ARTRACRVETLLVACSWFLQIQNRASRKSRRGTQECVRYNEILSGCRDRLLHNLFGSPPVVSGSSIRLSGRLPKYFCNVFDMFGDRFARIGNGQKPSLQRKQMTRQLIAPTSIDNASFLRFQPSSLYRRTVVWW